MPGLPIGGRGGGGGGVTLGPLQNTFGLTTTATKAAAETLRDTYALANAAWLALYTGDRSFLIHLIWTGNAQAYQRRNAAGTGWEDVTSVAPGTPGSPGGVGATGGAGAPGTDGSAGTDGAAGTDGTDGNDGTDGTPGSVGPIGPIGPGIAGTPTSLSRFEANTTANTVAQAMSAVYANILEIAATDIFANVGGFTVATVAGISTITIPNSGLFKITCHVKIVAGQTNRAQLYMRANILRNGVVVPNTDTLIGGAYVRGQPDSQSGISSGTTTLLLGLGDTVTFQMMEEGNTATLIPLADQIAS